MSEPVVATDPIPLSTSSLSSWRQRALELAHAGKWREATALQRALVSAHEGGAPPAETRDRFRALRWELALGRWREAMEEVDALYARLARRGGGSGAPAGWLFLARAIAQFQIGWGQRARRSLAIVLRVARQGGSPALFSAALELAIAFEHGRTGSPPRGALLGRLLQRVRSGSTSGLDDRVDPGCELSESEVLALLRDPGEFTLLRRPLPAAGFPWSRVTELLLGPPSLRSWLAAQPRAGAPSLLTVFLTESARNPTATVPAWLVPRLAREAEEVVVGFDAPRRELAREALSNLAARLVEPWARAELLSTVSELSIWCVGDRDVSPDEGRTRESVRSSRLVARARADLGLASGLFRQVTFERRAQECEERWMRLVRVQLTPPQVQAPAVASEESEAGATRRPGSLSLETVRRRAEAGGFVTGDPRLLRELSRLCLLAPSPLPVLILGESGTGKEVVARAIHRWSTRAGECVAIHCGAIPRDLLESELFGHARGAFTGAAGEKPGLVEAADGGTLFLDEIGEMGSEAQMKMLRVLESGEVRRVGDLRSRKVQVRLVAATHRDLDAAVREGHFRLDLLHRVRGITVRLPALRDRRSDIPRLVERFLIEVRSRGPVQLSDGALARLLSYPWPGNVRELRVTVLRAAYLAQALGIRELGPEMVDFPGETRELDDLTEVPDEFVRETESSASGDDVARSGLDRILEGMERRFILRALEENGWNRTRAAVRLGGLSRTTLLSKMKRLGIAAARSA